jgi:hypothetical protein
MKKALQHTVSIGTGTSYPKIFMVTGRREEGVRDGLDEILTNNNILSMPSYAQDRFFAVSWQNRDFPDKTKRLSYKQFIARIDKISGNIIEQDTNFAPFYLDGTDVLFISAKNYQLLENLEPVYKNKSNPESALLSLSFKYHPFSKIGSITTNNLKGNPARIQPIYKGDQIVAYAVPEEEIKAIMGDNVEYSSLNKMRTEQSFAFIRKPISAAKQEQRVGIISADLFEEHFENTGVERQSIVKNDARKAEEKIEKILKALNETLQAIKKNHDLGTKKFSALGYDFEITYGLQSSQNPEGISWKKSREVDRNQALRYRPNYSIRERLEPDERSLLRIIFDTVKDGEYLVYGRFDDDAIFKVQATPTDLVYAL